MISASLPGEALVQLGPLQLSHLYPAATMTPEFLAPPPRPYPRYAARRPRDLPPAAPFAPVPAPYSPFLPHPSYASYLYRSRAPQPPAYPLRPRPTSGFEPPMSPERGAPAPYFCRGALIRLEDGTLRRIEEMRTEDFVMSSERTGDKLQVGDVCVTLVARKHSTPTSVSTAPAPAPPQTHPENLSVKEDARKRRWSASDVVDEGPPIKKR
ncbi:unnamed protein product [Leptidea sinapis]|uniref:AXH domain-containing protein n=1 Tax=Leptidea sinapis TaxID=189913 RepID=A0A5E4R133_9NEOP|nr:unnamed protein product [Leptidea sinapis]